MVHLSTVDTEVGESFQVLLISVTQRKENKYLTCYLQMLKRDGKLFANEFLSVYLKKETPKERRAAIVTSLLIPFAISLTKPDFPSLLMERTQLTRLYIYIYAALILQNCTPGWFTICGTICASLHAFSCTIHSMLDLRTRTLPWPRVWFWYRNCHLPLPPKKTHEFRSSRFAVCLPCPTRSCSGAVSLRSCNLSFLCRATLARTTRGSRTSTSVPMHQMDPH